MYTDGACRGNPGPGGWGVLLLCGNKEKVLSGAMQMTTNNRMELTAAIEGLKAITKPCKIAIYTDSEYVKNGITQWINQWRQRRWRTAAGKPVKNQDLWQELDQVLAQHKDVEWHWVRGHSGDMGNERADLLARTAIDLILISK